MNPIGFSTGALALGDFKAALGCLRDKPYAAIELSALRAPELPVLLDAIPSLDLEQFSYVALHAPSKFEYSEESGIVKLLETAPADWTIILHPDTISDPECWRGFGGRLGLENMDRRKADGRSVEEMARWFSLLPEAAFCLDLAHAQQWDTTMTEAYSLLRAFSDRLCQVHLSQLDSASHHYPLSEGSVRAFSEVAWLIADDVPLIIESRISEPQMEAEAGKVRRIVELANRVAAQRIPA